MPSRKPARSKPVTAESQRNKDIRKDVARYVRALIRLYEATDPVHGPASEENKLEKARRAIELWWYLYGELLLWAQSQIVGYEYGRSNPEFIKKLSKTFEREITVDSHILEYIGLGFSWNRPNYGDPMMEKMDKAMEKYNVGMDTASIRLLIRELLVSRSANSSFWRFELQSALFALNLGHVEDILRPEPIRRQGNPVQLLNWKMRALQHVYFHIGRGLKKYRALQSVADALGQSTETLRSWEKFVSGDDDLMMDLESAKIAGALENDFDQHSIAEMIKLYPVEYHRNTTDIEYAKYTLDRIRSTPLDKIREGLRSSRMAKQSGS
jgi:hypothetical protein